MTTRFVLVRHATCAQTHDLLLGRVIDAPLDDEGERQARALAHSLRSSGVDRVHHSPRTRTRQTAEAIAAAAGCGLEPAPELDELDFGGWSGRSFAALDEDPAWRRWNSARGSSRTPAGEDIPAVQRRIHDYLRTLASERPGATLVLVSHAEVIRAALLRYLGIPADDFLRVAVEPASVARLRMAGDRVEVERISEPVAGRRTAQEPGR